MRRARRLLGHRSIWGEKGILPPASGSSSQWSFGVYGAVLLFVVRREHIVRLNVPSESALAQPPFTFSYRSLVVSLPLLNFCIAIQRRRSSVALDALAEMPEAQIHICLPHTTHAHTSRPRRTGGIAGVAPCEIPKHKSPRQWRGLLLISTDLLARVPEVILAEERCLEERDFAHSPFAQIGGDHSHCYPIRFRYPN